LPILPPSPWREFLQELDAKMTEVCRLPCFGGFAVTMEYGISRLTADIDVLDVAPPHTVKVLMREGGKGSPLALKHKVYLDFVGIANPPCDYESRLHPKRHIAVDTQGNLLAVVVHSAGIQDRAGARAVLMRLFYRFDTITKVFADGGYTGKLID